MLSNKLKYENKRNDFNIELLRHCYAFDIVIFKRLINYSIGKKGN